MPDWRRGCRASATADSRARYPHATLINADGFLAFMLAELPPMREFGLLAALAFLLSTLADFTALSGAVDPVPRPARRRRLFLSLSRRPEHNVDIAKWD